jgi:hypothetical protein
MINFEGIHVGGIRRISPGGLTVERNIQINGPIIVTAPIINRKLMSVWEIIF